MNRFTLQYLEGNPTLAERPQNTVRHRLRAAFQRLPITDLLVGWNLPPVLLETCQQEAQQAGARLFRWHPLLTGDGAFMPRAEWQTVGLDGRAVAGFQNMPEFTFVCPNRPAVRQAVLEHLNEVTRQGDYQGVFLDRVRFPSPAASASPPARTLACFCKDCQQAAAAEGLDLACAQQAIAHLASSPTGKRLLLQALLDPHAPLDPPAPDQQALQAFLAFRQRSVTRFVADTAALARARGLAIGLDCFSPCLARMVGQDLSALGAHCDWIKIMCYAHTLGPAGLPFELLGLFDWLAAESGAPEAEILGWLSSASRLPLPASRAGLRSPGLPPEALANEVRRGRSQDVLRSTSLRQQLLAGIELVEMPGITHLTQAQVQADLAAVRAAGADGLALSWDLWEMPLERLDWVRAAWFQ
ncbi:MAG: hypothetical protein AB1894_24965 [Chloroflexota bacterium]